MKKYTITEKEYNEMVEAMNTLTSENQKLRGFIDGMREQLIIGGVVSSACKKTEIIEVLNNRRKQAFDNQFHKYENNEMRQAIDIIVRLLPND